MIWDCEVVVVVECEDCEVLFLGCVVEDGEFGECVGCRECLEDVVVGFCDWWRGVFYVCGRGCLKTHLKKKKESQENHVGKLDSNKDNP